MQCTSAIGTEMGAPGCEHIGQHISGAVHQAPRVNDELPINIR